MRTLLFALLALGTMGCGSVEEISLRDPVFPESFPNPENPCSFIEWKTNVKPGLGGTVDMRDDVLPHQAGLQFKISARYIVPVNQVVFVINKMEKFATREGVWFSLLINVGEQVGMLGILTRGTQPVEGCPTTWDYVEIQ